MRSRKFSAGLMAVAIIALTVLGIGKSAFAQTEAVLHAFNDNNTDGFSPHASLIFDALGNLYGTTYSGGSYGNWGGGTVFELTPHASGGWTRKILYSFNGNLNSTDAFNPSAGVIFDSAGNLYGTTYNGGSYGYGAVFELVHAATGNWVEKILYSFNLDGKGPFNPDSSLVFDSAGDLYSTTEFGGTYSFGTVFELIPESSGNWTAKILHSFASNAAEGYEPLGGAIFVGENLYGTTHYGGDDNAGAGTVYELIPRSGGHWQEDILHTFEKDGTDGLIPLAGLVADSFGNLYGTTQLGGNGDDCGDDACGTAFQLAPNGDGTWAETILHNFNNNGVDGYYPSAGVTLDTAGNLYGSTPGGGLGTHCGSGGCGLAFKLASGAGGVWTETPLHDFGVSSNDATGTYTGLIIDASGNLYGTTYGGGAYGLGTVFEIKP